MREREKKGRERIYFDLQFVGRQFIMASYAWQEQKEYMNL